MKEFIIEYSVPGVSTHKQERVSAYNQSQAISELKANKGANISIVKCRQTV